MNKYQNEADILRWIPAKDGAGNYYELRDDNRVLSTLRFSPKPAVTWGYTDRRHATADAGSARWEFWITRKGFLGSLGLRATVHVTGSHAGEIAAGAFFFNGMLQLDHGRCFKWSGGATEGSNSKFLDEGERVLIIFSSGSIFDKVNAYVEVQPEGLAVSECPLLLALGLYLRLAMNKVYR